MSAVYNTMPLEIFYFIFAHLNYWKYAKKHRKMNIEQILASKVNEAVKKHYEVEPENIEFQPTRKDFEGDITLVVFPMLKQLRTSPAQLAEKIGKYLEDEVEEVASFNVIQGFLNIVISDQYYINFFNDVKDREDFGILLPQSDASGIMVEYSSPNTNKPLHLGHIRNNLLGYSVSEILKAAGNEVYKVQVINDRGIHICKSMVAWQKFGNEETPQSTGLKGDKLVGNYYVKFDQEYKKEIAQLKEEGKSEEEAKAQAPIFVEAQEMLRKWEANDLEVVKLWSTMNQWVYDGFEKTYDALGVDFDKNYYESETYILGKDNIQKGLEDGVFYKKDDGSVWIDLSDEGLDEKIVLRSDGTAVYMTQDIGTAIQRFADFDINQMVYTVGNEQEYHFKVLFLILKKLGYDWADALYHLSYGMVDLPSGKMKSREGTVVDADDLIREMAETAKNISEELGKLDGYSETEKEELYRIIGLGALKYYILKVDPKKRILFNPEESVDFQGNTGPFIQYTYARIQSILRKAEFDTSAELSKEFSFHEKEKELIKQVQLFPETIALAAENHSPALIANYTYELVKSFNSFYQNVQILGIDDEAEKVFRVQLSGLVANVIKSGFKLLGIEVPERM
ncbi:arginyl-tRNA synthetase [Christiangramia forsetii KT0803]|uniref:Arginine--tRNA ligase n=3 Tax=Christiangramia forsetii TaxID=411153 RepID=A0M557_CHRFK|nr:arginine--tRNA ligase [Christiangramia forsetii]CAL67752.1 arginyl-tRNA synthetase [Christiangramia forsetii KT0803]